MGNSLCKERIERADNSKNPVDRMIGRCAQICPNSFGNNKNNSNYWKNQILETGPPTRNQPKGNGNEWRTVTLNTVPQSNQMANIPSDVPIPPPRKKRNTLQRNQNGHPGGFKEVFGTPSRRSSNDSLEKFNVDSSLKRRNSSGDIQSDDFTDFSKDSSLDNRGIKRKVSKVGNKKSDRFLGENLSECLSNSPFLASTPILAKKVDNLSTPLSKDALETFVDSNVVKHDISQNNSKIMADRFEKPKSDTVTEVNQSKSYPIEMHIQYSKEPEQRPSLLNAAKTTINNYTENVENLDKRAEFLMTMVDHEFNNANETQPAEDVLTAPKRRRSKNIPSEELNISSETLNVPSDSTRDRLTDDNSATEATEKEIEVIRNGHVQANRNLQLDLSSAEKKKEFPKSEPDSPNIYAHLQPVVHELIVPVRKVYKHICDDDEHVHNRKHHHKHHDHVQEHSSKDVVDGKNIIPEDINEQIIRVEKNIIQENASPKKPERDFSRYRKSEDLSILEEPAEESLDSIVESQILRPQRKKGRSISRDSLPTPPPRPVTLHIDRKTSLQEPIQSAKKNRKISLQEPKRGLFEDQKLPDSPVTPVNTPILNDNEYEKIETFLKKCSSSQSFLTKELMDQLVDKVYGYSRNWDDQMEEGMLHTKCNDGSEKVGPSSKLTTRKISVIKKDPPIKINEKLEEVKKPTFSIGSSNLQQETSTTLKKEELPLPQPAEMSTILKREELTSPQPDNVPVISQANLIKRTDTVLELLPEGGEVKKVVTTTTTTTTTDHSNQPKEIHTVKTTIETSSPDLEVVNVLLKSTEIHEGSEMNALADIYKKNQDIMDDFKNYLEDKKINAEMMKVANNTEVNVIIDEEVDKSHNLFPDHVSITSFDSANNSDDDSDSLSFKNKRLAVAEEPRRGSIVDHDQWFLKHRDLSNQGRRGSDCPTTYDTTKLFPFGNRDKTYSQSSEFFYGDDDMKKSKSSDHVNLDGSSELDHSTLLKYFHTNNLNNSGK